MLSPQEREYIQMLGQGKTWSEIILDLKISPQRLSQIRRSIGNKLGFVTPKFSNTETTADTLWAYFKNECLSMFGPAKGGGLYTLTEPEFKQHVIQALS